MLRGRGHLPDRPPAGGRMTELPELPLEPWESTRGTLHLWAQIVGKVRLASTPPQNHWWSAPLYVDTRGLTTRRLRSGVRDFDVSVSISSRTSSSCVRARRSRSRFGSRTGLSRLSTTSSSPCSTGLDIQVDINAKPYGIPTTPSRPSMHSHDRGAVVRFWQALRWVDWTFQEFAGWFCGKTSPVHLFWHGFDLAATPQKVPEPTFYSYTAPEPAGLAEQRLRPDAASWQQPYGGSHFALLPYEAVRTSDDPRTTLLDFLQAPTTPAPCSPGGIAMRFAPPGARRGPSRGLCANNSRRERAVSRRLPSRGEGEPSQAAGSGTCSRWGTSRGSPGARARPPRTAPPARPR